MCRSETFDYINFDPDKIYQDIYDYVNADLDYERFDRIKLFHHCVKTCHKIFELSKFRYGKVDKNIPSGFLGKITMLCAYKAMLCSQKEFSAGEKYSHNSSYLGYGEGDCSIVDLSKIIFEARSYLLS